MNTNSPDNNSTVRAANYHTCFGMIYFSYITLRSPLFLLATDCRLEKEAGESISTSSAKAT
jgi:hypothetical protein